jgi:CRP-like cAMP-binding protein
MKMVDCMEKIHVKDGETIIKQGDSGDYFYVIYAGTVNFIVDGKVVGQGQSEGSFGELALLYTTPRAATVQATSPTVLFRVDQEAFRSVLLQQTIDSTAEKIDLLKKVAFLQDLDEISLTKLAEMIRPIQYAEGATIIQKGDTESNHCFILKSGAVSCTGAGNDSSQFEDVVLKAAGDYFGERALITGEPRAASVLALEDSLCFTIDREAFKTVLGDLKTVIMKSHEKRVLGSIKLLADSKLTSQSLDLLSKYTTEQTFAPGHVILEEGETTTAALYLIKSGFVVLEDDDDTRIIGPGLYFGDDLLLADRGRSKIRVGAEARTTPTYKVYVGDEPTKCGVLTLGSCRRVLDTRYIGTEHAMSAGSFFDSMIDKSMHLNDFQWHTILGAGTFGQVWLVSRNRQTGDRLVYGLKLQSKYELIRAGQAAAVVREKNIMANLQHPFLISLVNTYKDKHFLYMLLQLVQGGELYNLIYVKHKDGALAETDAKFYAACIAEGIGFMHRRGYVYRDLKVSCCADI